MTNTKRFNTRDEYRDSPRLNQSKIKEFLTDRDLFYHRHILKDEPSKPEPSHFAFGNMLEGLLLYDELPAVKIPEDVLNADGHRKGGTWTAWEKEAIARHGEDARLLTPKEWGGETSGVMMAREQIKAHPKASQLIYTPGATIHPRLSFELNGWQCKSELDIVCPQGIITDLKSTKCKNRREFMRDFINLKYHVQGWFYQEAWFQETGERLTFGFITVRNTFPYSVDVYEMSEEWLELGKRDALEAMDQMRACEESGDWSKPGYGEIQQLTPPPEYLYRGQYS